MTFQNMLDKYQYNPYVDDLIKCAACLPIAFPKERKAALWLLEEMDIQTRETLEGFAREPIPEKFTRGHLTDSELFMLWCRWGCALHVLACLTDALPFQSWLCIGDSSPAVEQFFLLSGLWREFGQLWMGQRAWRIEQGLPEPMC